MKKNTFFHQSFSFMLCFLSTTSVANNRFSQVEIQAQEITPGLHMLTGAGGNIGVSSGSDGLLIIDDQFAPLAERISSALAQLHPESKGKPTYIINTHHHGDHTGGNAHFGQDGTIVAHHNVLKNLKNNTKVNAENYPQLTYADNLHVHFNDQTIEVIHLGRGHTDGDSLVWFPKHNVLHMGDLFFNGRFPFVDQNHGGSVMQYLSRVDDALALINEQTIIIPGHGALASKEDLTQFKRMIEDSLAWAKSLQGQPLSQWHAQGLPAQYDTWGQHFISNSRWIETLWHELQEPIN
ncbi:MAG: MBL fold metallo-hydrolase [Ferrimonas sp.]